MSGNSVFGCKARPGRRRGIIALAAFGLAFLSLAALPLFSHAQSDPMLRAASTDASVETIRHKAESLRARVRAEDRGEDRAALQAEIARRLADVIQMHREPTQPELIVHLHQSREIARRAGEDDTDPTAEVDADADADADAKIDEVFRGALAFAVRGAEARGDHGLAAHAQIEGALLAERGTDDGAALELARAAATRAAAGSLRRPLYRAQWLLARIHRRAGDDAAALRAYRSAVSTLEGMKADLVAGTHQDPFSFRMEVAPVYLGLADLLLQKAAERATGKDPGADERDSIAQANQALLREARATLESSRQAELRDHFRDACLTQLESESTDAIPGTVVVYPVALQDRLVLIVGREGRLSQHLAPISVEDYAELTASLRIHLENRMTRRYRRPAAALYDALIRPIAERLEEAPVETLVFIPDRALRQIPLGALYHRESKRFLIEDYAVAIAPSLELTSPRRLPSRGAQLLAGALTQSVQGFPALEFVEEEVEAASQTFASEVLLDEALEAAALTNTLREMPFEVLHIASHAEFRSEANESFILTWDGKLSLTELSGAIGGARFRTERPLELLVLSACETAVGDDRAVLGLAGAAVQMGARSVLASLWSVNDEASSTLMARFYVALREPGATRAGALRAAQRSLIAEKAHAHPSAWAPFVLIGSWL